MMEAALYWYAIIFAALLVLSGIGKTALKLAGKYEVTPKPVQIEELVSISILLISIFALYGYVRNVLVFSALFWQIYFFLLIAHGIGAFWLPKLVWLKNEVSLNKFIVINLVGFIVSIPFYYIMFRYAFSFAQ
jgi:hypothetical protein